MRRFLTRGGKCVPRAERKRRAVELARRTDELRHRPDDRLPLCSSCGQAIRATGQCGCS